MNISKLDHVALLVKDVGRSCRFYAQVLGLREIPRPSNIDNAGAWLTNNEHSFEVHLISEANELARGFGTHVAFEVINLEATIQHLHALHVEIVGGPRPRDDGVQQLYICDPDGYMIELFVWETR